MMTDLARVTEAVVKRIDEPELGRIEGWEGLAMFAEKAVLEGVEIASLEGQGAKWCARGHVSLGLINWDEERFGAVRLHLLASGHLAGAEISVDCMVISPEMN